MPLTDRAKQVAGFVVNGAVYQCQVMPYGMKNCLATSQRFMDQVVEGVENCTVYIDDVVVFDICWEEHVDHVGKLIRCLGEAGLVVNLQKCEFVQGRVQYLWYAVGHGQVYSPRAKVEAINTLTAAHCRRAHQRFLTDLLRRNKEWEWSAAGELAFTTVKLRLCQHPILRAPDFNRPFVLSVDASQVGAGAMLMQQGEEEMEHQVPYFSKTFTSTQKNYSVVEKELLAILLALQHFAVYLSSYGPVIKVYSDNYPLQVLDKYQFKNQRVNLLLQEYNLYVKHTRGVDNVTADCLSREGS